MKPLNTQSNRQIGELLTPLMTSEQDRRALLTLAFINHPLLSQIDFSGSTANFLPNMIEKLYQFGKLDDGRPALWTLLEVVREQVGLDQKHLIDALRPAFELPPPPRLDRIFVSYSRQNERDAQRIVSDLKDAGLRVWFDREKIKAGEEWWRSIERGIINADFFMFCISPSAIESDIAKKELITARQNKKPIYAIMLEDCWAQINDKNAFAHKHPEIPWLTDLHIIDFIQPERYGDRLRELIQSLPGYTPPDTYFIEQMDTRDLPNPFRGLEAFLELDADYFFGRDDAIKQLLNQVSDLSQSRLLAVVGASGSGKSSLVRAGLIPALRDTLPFWETLTIRPGNTPLNDLADRLQLRLGFEVEHVRERLREHVSALDDIAAELMMGKPEDARFVLVIDQFEELFTLTSKEECTVMLDLLIYAVERLGGRVQVIMTMRADFFDRLSSFPGLASLVRENLYIATEMHSDQLRHSIEDPARKVSVTYEDGLVEKILDDVREQPGSLPLLQYALKALFERKVGWRMTHDAYQSIGGVKQALATRAETIYNALNSEHQEALRLIMLRLIEVEDETITRRRVTQSELVFNSIPYEITNEILKSLTDAENRLLIVSAAIDDAEDGQKYYEVSHEALLSYWERLKDWIAEKHDDLRLDSEFRRSAGEWENSQRNKDFLLQGTRLAVAQEWSLRFDAPTQLQRDFIQISAIKQDRDSQIERERQERELQLQKRALNRTRILAGAFAIFLVVAIGLSVFALDRQAQAETSRQEADNSASFAETQAALAAESEANALAQSTLVAQQRDRAESLRLASESQSALLGGAQNAETSALLSLQALRYNRNTRAQDQLQDSLAQLVISQVDRMDSIGNTIRLSPDGNTVLTGQFVDSAYPLSLVDRKTHQILQTFAGHTTTVSAARFSNDGSRLFSADFDETLFLWDVASAEKLHRFPGHDQDVMIVAFSPDNKRLLSADLVGQVKIWDAETGDLVQSISGGLLIVDAVFLSGDREGQIMLASASEGVSVWDIETGEQIGEPYGNNSVALLALPQKNQFLSADESGKINLYNFDDPEPVYVFSGHTGTVKALALSPTQEQFASGGGDALDKGIQSVDQTVRLWDLIDRTQVGQTMSGHTGDVDQINFGSNGSLLSLSSDEDAIRIWTGNVDLRSSTLTSVSSGSGNFDVSPDNTRLATIQINLQNADNEMAQSIVNSDIDDSSNAIAEHLGSILLHVQDITTGQTLYEIDISKNPSQFLRYSPDGKYLLSFNKDLSFVDTAIPVFMWQADTGELIYQKNFEGQGVEFSPDGNYLLILGYQNVALAKAETGEIVQEFKADEGGMEALFSPDSRYLLIYHMNKDVTDTPNIILWDTVTNQQIFSVSQYIGVYNKIGAAFSPDNRYVALAHAFDVKIWDTGSGEPVSTLDFSDRTFSDANALAFTPDSKYLIVGYDDTFASDPGAERFQISDGQLVTRYPYDSGAADAIYVSPSGDRLIIDDEIGEPRLFDLNTGALIALIPSGSIVDSNTWLHGRETIFAADGSTFITQTSKTVYIWDANSGQQIDLIEANRGINSDLQDVRYAGSAYVLASFMNLFDADNVVSWNVLRNMTGYNAWIDYACSIIPRDLTREEREAHLITDGTPTCGYDVGSQSPQAIVARLYADEYIPQQTGFLMEQYTRSVLDLSQYDNTTLWIPVKNTYADYILGATVEWGNGASEDHCGLLFGFKSDSDFVTFSFNQIGSLGFRQRSDAAWNEFSQRDEPVNINTGANTKNQVLLVVHDGYVTAFVNGQPSGGFGLFDDPGLVTGQVGIMGTTLENSTDSSCIFDNIWVWDLVATVPPTATPTPPPTSTAIASGTASIGENRGQLEIGEGDVWYFSGTPGQTIGIRVAADHPANDSQDRTGLLDTQVFLRAPDGSIIAQADDIEDGKITDSIIESIELPVTGQYEIEVRSYQNATGGQYTLTISSP